MTRSIWKGPFVHPSLLKKIDKLKDVPNKTTANIKNALFVGSTTELQKMLNKDKDMKKVVEPDKEKTNE